LFGSAFLFSFSIALKTLIEDHVKDNVLEKAPSRGLRTRGGQSAPGALVFTRGVNIPSASFLSLSFS
jgi:hypothetical protein